MKAINDVSFEVLKGEPHHCPNGAGKSSMLNVINGFYKPTSGNIEFPKASAMETASAAANGIADFSEHRPVPGQSTWTI